MSSDVDIRAALRALPALDRFPLVDELSAELDDLAARYPDLVTVRRIGTSRLGDPIRMASIGSGDRDALVFGGPHPNEPVGFASVRELGRLLCADDGLRTALGFRWHLIPCVDPDGARLNESWYGRPGDREAYARGFYRPAGDEQVEWTFAHRAEPGYFDRVLPETTALAHAIDTVRPVLQSSLHNGEYGGVFHYLRGDHPDLPARLAEVAGWVGLAPHNAVWEMPESGVLAPGVLRMPTAQELVVPDEPVTFGASSADYASRYGTTTVVSEVPYWEDARAADTSPCGSAFGEVVRTHLALMREVGEVVGEVYRAALPDLALDTPFRRSTADAVEQVRAMCDGWSRALEDPATARRPATVAEECSFEVLPHVVRLRLAGTLLRVFRAEIGVGNTRAGVREGAEVVERLFTTWLAEADKAMPGEPIELRRLVATQIGAALTAAATLR
ncbi:M14 family zinc carboxypeptidase [Actinosynnema sp. NPDC050436]|uniref:M14 family zinc carboxypeptidase n=1 Tax=Actinosynnema sp. NPDC050436 TaxID=3155659 RepID=UPI00340AE65C